MNEESSSIDLPFVGNGTVATHSVATNRIYAPRGSPSSRRRATLNTVLFVVAALVAVPAMAWQQATISRPGEMQTAAGPFASHAADADQLNLPNGCFLEAIRFKALHPGNDSGIVVVNLNGLEHAIVAYPKDGKLWSHCSMLGDVSLRLKASELNNIARVQCAYARRFADQLQRVERRGQPWPVKDARPGDTPAIQVVRASLAMDSLRIKNVIVAYTKTDGQKSYALITAVAKGMAVYAPEVGSIQLGIQEFGPEMAHTFATEYLGFVPVKVGYEHPAKIVGAHAPVDPAVAAGSVVVRAES